MRHADDPVPLPWVTGLGRDFLIFIRVLARRLGHYAICSASSLYQRVNFIFYRFCQLKNFLVRLLLRRSGFFARRERLGFLTLSGTAVFSLVLAPSFDSLSSSYQIQQVIKANSVNWASINQTEGIVLAGSNNTLMEQQTTAVVKPSDPARQQVIEYEVQSGDTLSGIGERFLVSVEALKYVNNLQEGALLHPGEKVTIPPVDGLIYKVAEGDTVASIAEKHHVSPQAIVDANLIAAPFIIHAGDELVIPGGTVPTPQPLPAYLAKGGGQKEAIPAGGLSLQPLEGSASGSGFMMPTAGTITQYFSWYHPAVDIANGHCGTPVVAAAGGQISFAGWWKGGGGNSIFINHQNSTVTKYAHLSAFARKGGFVSKGEVIGYTGATGRAYGCHLHYVVEKGGRAVNPLGF